MPLAHSAAIVLVYDIWMKMFLRPGLVALALACVVTAGPHARKASKDVEVNGVKYTSKVSTIVSCPHYKNTTSQCQVSTFRIEH